MAELGPKCKDLDSQISLFCIPVIDSQSVVPKSFSGGLRGKDYLSNTKILFAFFAFVLSKVYGGVSQELHDMILQEMEFQDRYENPIALCYVRHKRIC